MSGCASFACFHRFQFSSYVCTREVLARFCHFDQSIRNWHHSHLAQMQHYKRCVQSFGKINRLKSLSYSAVAFLGGDSRELITIRRSHHYLDRQWTKIMQTCEAHLTCLEHFLNS